MGCTSALSPWSGVSRPGRLQAAGFAVSDRGRVGREDTQPGCLLSAVGRLVDHPEPHGEYHGGTIHGVAVNCAWAQLEVAGEA